VRYILKDYQLTASTDITRALRRAGNAFDEDPTD